VADGDRGEVVGRSTTDPKVKVYCKFPNYTQNFHTFVSELELELPGGYRIGDVVINKFDIKNGNGSVADGDRGEVIGRSPKDPKTHLLCRFPQLPRVSCLPHGLALEALGGFQIGDPVIKKGAFKDANGSVADGDRGEVVGRSTTDPKVKVYCKFPNYAKHFHALVGDLELELPAGFRIGDTVIRTGAFFKNEHGSVADGERGEVIGRATGKWDPQNYVLCKFPNFSRLIVLIGHLGLEALGGFQMGDTVIKKGAFQDANGSVADGDHGEVVGRSTTDPGVKVYCMFPDYAGYFHAFVSELDLGLPGGFRIGDTVIFKAAFENEDGSVADGERGEVVDRSSTNSRGKVLCKFTNLSVLLDTLVSQLELELPGGFRIGNTVIFRGALRGEVVGRSLWNPESQVLCKFLNHAGMLDVPSGELILEDPVAASRMGVLSSTSPRPFTSGSSERGSVSLS